MTRLKEYLIKNMKYLFVLLVVFILGCQDQGVSNKKTVGTLSTGYLQEFEFEGCQYLSWDRSITHKGNCTNVFHKLQ